MRSGDSRGRCRWLGVTCLGLLLAVSLGCRSLEQPPLELIPEWDVDRARIVTWHAAQPEFDQDHAIEASGLAATGRRLYIASEKYARLLVVGGATSEPPAQIVRLSVPQHAELEGTALTRRTLLLCDEAHAAVYEVSLAVVDGRAARGGTRPLSVRTLAIRGMLVRGGKIGFEGIEYDPMTGDVLLLLERSHVGAETCVSRLFRLRRKGELLLLKGDPLEIELQDCAWRITGLAWAGGHLLGLRTQFPGERYEVVRIDMISGHATVLMDLTELLRGVVPEGWGNNVEGIAVAADGALWLVADNAVTGVIDESLPPPAEQRTLLLRIPAVGAQ